jgi:hypothetical protein
MKAVPFANELQKDWELLECVVVHREAIIRVRAGKRHEFPDAGGQHGSKVLSHPVIYSEHLPAEFRFTRCLMVRSWDEMTLSIRELNPEPQFEGRTFRRYSKSALLDFLEGELVPLREEPATFVGWRWPTAPDFR